VLQAHEVTFGYGRDLPLLRQWSTSVQDGEMVGITGPSGRGKSTLLYLLGLMLRPREGEVLIDGTPTSELRDPARARMRAHLFGFVFQDAALDATRTVLDNITEAALYRGDELSDARSRARDLLDRLGVAVPADRRPGQVSGGQAQRIALCRALLHDPRIVLADEPTGNLDVGSADQVMGALRAQAQRGSAVLVVTHDPRAVEGCDRVIEL
jgi:ABC-type lipoprotein export system ATPase subunit